MFAEYLMRVGHHSGDMCQERDGLAKLEAALAQCRQYNTARLTVGLNGGTGVVITHE
jgi:hypothetical protein